ncbi:MAG: DUF1552 domain-containing protein [Verrucomicrobiaceae bacterium]|nr:DUF1552 domain-containing protein [Verrucomicrobiaceae bacterium]
MNTTSSLHRRNFLRGLGACVGLPTLESLVSRPALGAGTTTAGAPLRMAFIYSPNGVILDPWRPQGEGADFKFGPTMEPLSAHRDHIQIYTGFEQANGWSGPDGGGDHARANASILTGARPRKTAGSDIHLGMSVDQVAAKAVGDATRFRSLELSCDSVRGAGACDSGYSCAYQFNISWRSETAPATPETNPRQVFERLFGAGSGSERAKAYAARQMRQKSILDFVMEDAHALNKQLGRNDRNKMDEYLTGVREIEQRIERAERFGPPPDPGQEAPEAGIPSAYEDHIRLMMDMQVLAFQTDSTRISTLLLAHDGSNRSFKEIGISEGHHYLSHHQLDKAKMAKIQKIDLFYVRQFAYYLQRMKAIKEANGLSLLDNSMVVYCSGLSDANRHRHDDLPVILAGKAGGKFQPGRHTNFGTNTPMSNLHLRLLHEMGVPAPSFGDSTAVLQRI